MTMALDPITEAATAAASGALPEFVTVGGATLLPRGADPFTGGEFPTLVAATRWVNVAPGGVLVGGSPDTMATILGFDLPPVPEKPSADAPPADPDAPAPPKWADLVAEAARPVVTTITQAVASSVAALAGLPPECSPTQVEFCTNDTQLRMEVGSVSDAVVLLLSAEDKDVRLVVVVPGIFMARLRAAESNGGPTAPEPEGEESEEEAPPAFRRFDPEVLDAALSKVPMDCSIELGSARVPLSQVLHLQDGEVLELQEGIEAPVELVSGGATVARGDLEVGEAGSIVLHVTSIPGRTAAAFPRLMDGRAGDEPGDPSEAPRAEGDHEALAEAPLAGDADAGAPVDEPAILGEPGDGADGAVEGSDAADEPPADA
ncbi:MAG: FliM/FliN family flagellar motor switch protein [Solirubrobacteraceae bacterium]|nr:FliM/FliN family flagellar motor switch protein [Patulibacter sp.]